MQEGGRDSCRLGGYIRIRWAQHAVVHLIPPPPCPSLPPPARRSKTQGIALSLGDKLILKQKGSP